MVFWGVVKGGEGWPKGEEVESREKSYERERERKVRERMGVLKGTRTYTLSVRPSMEDA